jgi:two-component system, chemotaxis family, protein-glutamate methylesterase/glutaminase
MMPSIVVIGTSAGGLSALQILLPGLPGDFPLPLVLVQHRGKEAGGGGDLCDFLQKYCGLPLSEPEDKEPIATGRVYLAPRDYHLLIEGRHFALSTEAPVCYARPSIDVLFESAADAYGKETVGIILTGKNRDGARGLAAIKACGGLTVIEEPATAQSREMPEAALAATLPHRVLPVAGIAPFLSSLCQATMR